MPALQTEKPLKDEVPWSNHVTDYDRAHFPTYLRLLDARRDGATKDEMCSIVLGIDPNRERSRARKMLASHLWRARWMTQVGYRDLLDS